MKISNSGLSEAEAIKGLEEFGYNELPSSERRSFFQAVLSILGEPMFMLLAACALIYFLIGDVRGALMLAGFVVVVIAITVAQERKTDRTLSALRDMSSPRAMVVRDGAPRRISGREVVPGDLIMLGEGDRVPADAQILSSVNLACDESMLTGESVSVQKECFENEIISASKDEKNRRFVYSGTLVVSGQGAAVAVATGRNTELGKLGKSLESVANPDFPIQTESRRVVKVVTIFAVGLFVLVVSAYVAVLGRWLEGLLAGLTMAMSILPEEIPVIMTVFFALGAWRISQNKILTRSIPAVETIGAVTTLCVDKTGTLTQNKMTLARLFTGDEYWDLVEHGASGLPEKFHGVVEYGILAGKKSPFDPMEKGFLQLGETWLAGSEHIHEERVLIKEYPLLINYSADAKDEVAFNREFGDEIVRAHLHHGLPFVLARVGEHQNRNLGRGLAPL